VALVDARGSGIDDDEHFRGEVLAAAVENHARNLDVVAFAWALAQVELQHCQPVLAVDDEELGARFLQVADVLFRGEPLGNTSCRFSSGRFSRGHQRRITLCQAR
jgi:hypothetical protein